MTFTQAVWEIVRGIPKGWVMSYGQVASHAGYPHAARAVGRALSRCPHGDVPCHRVVRQDGSLADKAFAPPGQRVLLERESVTFTQDGAVNMIRHKVPYRCGRK